MILLLASECSVLRVLVAAQRSCGFSAGLHLSELVILHQQNTPIITGQQVDMMKPGAGPYVIGRNARFGSEAATQKSEKCRIAEFGAEEAPASVCFRPKADIKKTPPRWGGFPA